VPRKPRQATRRAIGQEFPALRLSCNFFSTESGNEPVRDWLKETVPVTARKTVGGDIKTVQATWPIDKPLVDNVAPGLWEVRSTQDKIEYRVVFMLVGNAMILLHGFTKNSAKTKKADIDLALKRKASWEKMK
jgi:phage-related protein